MRNFLKFLVFFLLSLSILFFGCKTNPKKDDFANKVSVKNENYSEISEDENKENFDDIDAEELEQEETI